DPEMTVRAELSDVAAVHPAVPVDRVLGLGGIAKVADHHVAAPHQDLAVLAQPHLDARKWDANRWRAMVAYRHDGRRAGELAHAPDLVERHPQRGPELVDLGPARRRAGDGGLASVETNLGAKEGEQGLRLLDPGRELWRNIVAIAPESICLLCGGDRALRHLPFGLVGLGGDPGEDAGHELFP